MSKSLAAIWIHDFCYSNLLLKLFCKNMYGYAYSMQPIACWTLKVIYHPKYSMNNFVTNKSKLPQDWAQLFPCMGWLAIMWPSRKYVTMYDVTCHRDSHTWSFFAPIFGKNSFIPYRRWYVIFKSWLFINNGIKHFKILCCIDVLSFRLGFYIIGIEIALP